MGLPQNFQPIVLNGDSSIFFIYSFFSFSFFYYFKYIVMRMTNILGPMERRAMCTAESFGVDAERTEVKIRTMSKESKPVPTNSNYILFLYIIYNIYYNISLISFYLGLVFHLKYFYGIKVLMNILVYIYPVIEMKIQI